MTLTEWKNQQFRYLTWDYIAREIAVEKPEGESFYTNRLNRLRSGKSQPKEWERRSLMSLTNNDVDSFYDPQP